MPMYLGEPGPYKLTEEQRNWFMELMGRTVFGRNREVYDMLEIEKKYIVSTADVLNEVRDYICNSKEHFTVLGSGQISSMDTYGDTPDRALMESGRIFRTTTYPNGNKSANIVIKIPSDDWLNTGVKRHTEHVIPLDGSKDQQSIEEAILSVLPDLQTLNNLNIIFTIMKNRNYYDVLFKGHKYQVCLDRLHYIRRQPEDNSNPYLDHMVEVELRDNATESDFKQFTDLLEANVRGLRVTTESVINKISSY